MSDARKPKIAAKARLRHDPVENKMMLMFPEAALQLNPTAAEVLKLCDGERTLDQIVEALVTLFAGSDRAVVAREATSLLERLAQKGLVEL